MSELRVIWKRHELEVRALRQRCPHRKEDIVIRCDGSNIGKGALYPAVHVICTNCGRKKIIFGLSLEKRKKVKKRLTRQGFKDERLEGRVQYNWELAKV